jgi:hypothetical protein
MRSLPWLRPPTHTNAHCIRPTHPPMHSRCDHVVSHSEVHDCRGLGLEWPSSAYPCNPSKSTCYPDPDPNVTGTGVMLNQVVGANVSNNFIHDVNYHGVFLQARLSSNVNHTWPGSGQQTPSALNTIELNRIQDWFQCTGTNTSKGPSHCRTGADGGCVYFFTYLWSYGQTVRYNFCHQTRPDLWPVGKVLYLDGDSSGIETWGNIACVHHVLPVCLIRPAPKQVRIVVRECDQCASILLVCLNVML